MTGYVLAFVFLSILAALPLGLWFGYRESLRLGVERTPLTPDDRLRLSLALKSLETARRELEKARTYHPHINSMLVRVARAEHLCDTYLRGSALSHDA